MARQGRFGRGTTGSANLSSFINGLVRQSESMNERALLNAFKDQTEYGGSVPQGQDIEEYVASKLQGLDPNSAEYSYYVNLRENALRSDRGRQAQSVTTAFNATMGDNFGQFYDEISALLRSGDLSDEEQSEYQALLASKTSEYVSLVAGQYENGSVTYEELLSKTDGAIGLLEGTPQENAIVLRANSIMKREAQSLNSGMLSGDEYRSRVTSAFGGIDPDSPTAFDLKNNLFTTIWNREIDAKYNRVNNAADKPTGTQIKRTQEYLEWAKGKLADLVAAGVTGGELYDTIKGNIGSYNNTLSELKVRAGNELYADRKANTEASRNVLDAFAAQAAVYVTGAALSSLRDMSGGVTLNNLLAADPFAMVRYFDINPSAQADFDAALGDYRDIAKGLVATAKAIGAGAGEAMSLRKDATEVARYTGQDTTLEDYEDAFDKKLGLIGNANGDDSVIESINNDWLRFLKGQNTGLFGKGIAAPTGGVFAGLIGNETAVYEVGSAGGEIGAIGATFLDYILPSQATEEGDTRTNSQIESENAAKTTQMSTLLKEGKAVRFIDASGKGSTIGIRQADQGSGEFMFAERNANGNVRATIRQGVPVVGTYRGSEIKNATWGFYYPDTKTWVEASTGKTFTKPPIEMRNGGAPEFDQNGNPTRVTFDIREDALAADGISLAEGVGRGVVSAAKYIPKDVVDPKTGRVISQGVVEVSTSVAIVGKDSWRTGDSGSLINKNTLDAITYSFTEDQKTEIENDVAIYNERAGRFDVGYGESRLTPETTSGSVVNTPDKVTSTFEKFLGSGSLMPNGAPRTGTFAVKGADGKIIWGKINYSDAYTQTSPGVFVRKESATAYAINGTGLPADEANQFFPKTIDVSSLTETPLVKPYVDSGFVKTPKASGGDTSTATQNYFFRNSNVSSINNRDITDSRARTASPIQTSTSLMLAQPIIDFRASERAPLTSTSLVTPSVSPITLKPPVFGLTSQPLADFRAGERVGVGIQPKTPVVPKITDGTSARGR